MRSICLAIKPTFLSAIICREVTPLSADERSTAPWVLKPGFDAASDRLRLLQGVLWFEPSCIGVPSTHGTTRFHAPGMDRSPISWHRD